MKIFLDANILVSVLNKEYPFFTYTSRILSLKERHGGFILYTSPVCLAIAFYFAEKKFKSVKAKEKVRVLCEHIQIAEVGKNTVLQALKDPSVNDFADGIEYYSAIENGCHCIITEDVNDFYFSKIEVLRSIDFFEKYLLHK